MLKVCFLNRFWVIVKVKVIILIFHADFQNCWGQNDTIVIPNVVTLLKSLAFVHLIQRQIILKVAAVPFLSRIDGNLTIPVPFIVIPDCGVH